MGWSNNSEMLAGINDQLIILNRNFVNVNSKTADTSEMVFTQRPYAEKHEPETVSFADFAKMMKGE